MTVKYATLAAIAQADFNAEIDVNSLAHIIEWPLYRTRWELKRAGIEIMTKDEAIRFVARRKPEAVVSMAEELRLVSKNLQSEKAFNELLQERVK